MDQNFENLLTRASEAKKLANQILLENAFNSVYGNFDILSFFKDIDRIVEAVKSRLADLSAELDVGEVVNYVDIDTFKALNLPNFEKHRLCMMLCNKKESTFTASLSEKFSACEPEGSMESAILQLFELLLTYHWLKHMEKLTTDERMQEACNLLVTNTYFIVEKLQGIFSKPNNKLPECVKPLADLLILAGGENHVFKLNTSGVLVIVL